MHHHKRVHDVDDQIYLLSHYLFSNENAMGDIEYHRSHKFIFFPFFVMPFLFFLIFFTEYDPTNLMPL